MIQIHVAVIGTGSIGSRHLEVLRRIDSVVPIAIPKRPDRIRRLHEEGFNTAKDLAGAAEQGARLCIIASDTGRHLPDGLMALDCGMDVLIEKPLGCDGAEARCLIQRSRSVKRKLFVAYVLRFSESLNAFREALPGIGVLHSVRIETQSYLPDWHPSRDYRDSYSARADEGGVLRDMVHEIDYAGWLFGWPAAVQGRVVNLGRLGIAADEVAELTWKTHEGCEVSIRLDYLSRPTRRRLTACGESGTIEWDGVSQTVKPALADLPEKELRSGQSRDEMFSAQARAFIETAVGTCNPLLATGVDGMKALAVCDAARRASSSRREERVEYS